MAQPNSQQETFSNVQPIQQASSQQETFSNVTPINAQPSVWDVLTQPTDKTDQEYTRYTGPAGVAGATIKGLDDVARGTRGALAGAWNTVRHPIDTAKSIAELPAQATQVRAAFRDINQSPDPFGVYASVAQDTAAQGAGQALAALGTAGVAKGAADAAPYVGPVGGALIKGYAKKLIPDEALTAYKAVKNTRAGQLADAMQPDPAAVSSSRTMPGQVAPEIIQPPQPAAPQPRGPLYLPEQTPSTIDQVLNSPSRSLSGQIAAEITRPSDQAPPSPIPSRSGLALPSAPLGAELSELPATGAKPAAATGEALNRAGQAGQLAESMQEPAPSADAGAGFKRGSLGDLLDQSLGAKKLEPNVPLRQQMPAAASISQAGGVSAGDLPEGHTPVQSSWIKSYKYDPATREFEMAPKSGTPVRLGDVSPEDAQAFADAKSQGKAWQQIKNNVLVAKRINGKWTPVKAGQ